MQTPVARVIVHDRFRLQHFEIEDPQEDLRAMLEPGGYTDAMDALGFEAIIDI